MKEQSDSSQKACPAIVFACSGAADVGEISDRAARQLAKEGIGAMSCLAGLSGHAVPVMDSALRARAIVAIDGCPEHCAAKTLAAAGFNTFEHVRLADLGMVKKESPATDIRIAMVVQAGKRALNVKPI